MEQARTARAQRFSKWLLASVAAALVLFAGLIAVQSRGVARERSGVLIVAAEDSVGKHAYDRALRFAVRPSTWLSAQGADAQLAAGYAVPEASR